MNVNANLRSLVLLACALCTSFSAPLHAGSATYKYDAIGRLKSVTYADGTVITFSLDAAGNRTTVTSTTLPAGTLQFTAPSYSAGEAAGQRTVTLNVSRTAGSANTVTVNYATENGTATVAGGDYTAASGQLSWAPGDTANKSFTVSVNDDATYEGSEGFAVRLTSPSGGSTLGTTYVATINITDDETPPRGVLALSNSVYSTTENGGNYTITVTRTGGSYGAANVSYANAAGGTAVLGTDFNAFANTLYWADGETASKTFVIPVLDDSVFDGSKSINFAINGAVGAGMGSPSSAVLNISDNEVAQPGVISISPNTYIVGEAAGSQTVTVTRTAGTDNALDVSYATSNGSAVSGADYTATSGVLHWNSGEGGSKTFSVAIVDDVDLESSETIALSLTSIVGGATGGTTTGTITISDNETLGNVQFVNPTYSVTEGGTVTLQLTRQVNATGAASVLVNAPGYITNQTVSWNSGELGVKPLGVSIPNDVFANGTRTFTATLSNISGASYGTNTTATVTITDDEPPLVVSINSPTAVLEGGVIALTVGVNVRTNIPVTVNYSSSSGTATQGVDYTGVSGTLTIPNQAWGADVLVNTTDDSSVESAFETFTVTISNPSGSGATIGTATGTGTIQDNESPTPSVPLNLRKNPTGGWPVNYTMLWDPPTSGTVHHYTLSETGSSTGTYTIVAPTTQYAFAKGSGPMRAYAYQVRACATADESACSAYTATYNAYACTQQCSQ